jgi:translation initiation factor IF-3
LTRPPWSRFPAGPTVRINGKIRAREVRVITSDGRQLGVLSLGEAINLARTQGVDLVEVAPNATPPVCRIVDFGKYQYELAKKEKESKKHQHSNRVKEIQLRPSIDPHDFGVKLGHAIDFLCEDMKVKLSLRFRGREMAHKEIGMQVVVRFIKELALFGTAIEQPKIVGRGMSVMVNPLPRNKRAKNPRESAEGGGALPKLEPEDLHKVELDDVDGADEDSGSDEPAEGSAQPAEGFVNNPFGRL